MSKSTKNEHIHKTIESLYDKIHVLGMKSDWQAIDSLLAVMNFEITPEIRIAVLTGTLFCKSKLSNRIAYFDKTVQILKKLDEGDPLAVLRGLL